MLSTVTMTTENSASCQWAPCVPRRGLDRQAGPMDAHQCTGYRADRVRWGQPWALGWEGPAGWDQDPLGTSQLPEGSGQRLAPVLGLCAGVPVVLDMPFGRPSATLAPKEPKAPLTDVLGCPCPPL